MQKYIFWAGGYGSPDEKTLFRYEADFETKSFKRLVALSGLENPSYLAKHGDILYAVEEIPSIGNVLTFFTGGEGPHLVTREITLAGDPCHIALSEDCLIVSNYSGATPGGGITLYKINPDGTTSGQDFKEQRGSGPVRERQTFAHAHSAYIDGDRVIACDLGADMLFRYRIENGKLFEEEPWYAPVGSGPRHMAVNGDVFYLLGELSAKVYVLKNGIALIKLIQRAEVLFQASIFQMLLDDPQAQGVECANIHLVDIGNDPPCSQLIGDSRNELFCSLLRKGCHKDRLWPDAFLLNKVDCTLHQREGFPGSRTSSNQNRAICCFNRPFLALICMPKIKHIF